MLENFRANVLKWIKLNGASATSVHHRKTQWFNASRVFTLPWHLGAERKRRLEQLTLGWGRSSSISVAEVAKRKKSFVLTNRRCQVDVVFSSGRPSTAQVNEKNPLKFNSLSVVASFDQKIFFSPFWKIAFILTVYLFWIQRSSWVNWLICLFCLQSNECCYAACQTVFRRSLTMLRNFTGSSIK